MNKKCIENKKLSDIREGLDEEMTTETLYSIASGFILGIIKRY